MSLEILNEQPGSETASLLDVEVKTDPKEEYEDDFTDEDISTTSAITEGDLRKVQVLFLSVLYEIFVIEFVDFSLKHV